jgi:leucyl-tRNA synthetase
MANKKSSTQTASEKLSNFAIDRFIAETITGFLRIETDLANYWESSHIHEIDAPSDGSTPKKFFVTFPYPSMNGRLHLGHLFESPAKI